MKALNVRIAAIAIVCVLICGCGGGGDGSGKRGASTYPLTGTVAGLTSGSVELANGIDNTKVVASRPDFTFPELPVDALYEVRVTQQPAGTRCDVIGGSGKMIKSGAKVDVVCSPVRSVLLVAGTVDVPGEMDTDARKKIAGTFSGAHGIAADASGNRYVADKSSHTIRKVDDRGNVETIAGDQVSGYADGPGSEARFSLPADVAVDVDGNVYVSDTGNRLIRKIDPAHVVSTIAGSPPGIEPIGGAPAMRALNAIAIAADGTLYVSDAASVLRVALDRSVSVYVDGLPWEPAGLAIGSDGRLYLAGGQDGVIEITPAETRAGRTIRDRRRNATAQAFNNPKGIAVDDKHLLYVADSASQLVRRIDGDDSISIVAGTRAIAGHRSGPAKEATFYFPLDLSFEISRAGTPAGLKLHVCDGNETIRTIDLKKPSELVNSAGSPPKAQFGFRDGAGDKALFRGPQGVASSSQGSLYVADTLNNVIRRIDGSNKVSTIAGSPKGVAGYRDKSGDAARFSSPQGIAVGPGGSIYVADTQNNMIRKIVRLDKQWQVSTVDRGVVFNAPTAIAVDADETLYVIESARDPPIGSAPYNKPVVRKVTATGQATEFRNFEYAAALVLDGLKNLYVADKGNSTIVKIAASGVLAGEPRVIAGRAEDTGSRDTAENVLALFNGPTGIAFRNGYLYISDEGNGTLRELSLSDFSVRTVAGNPKFTTVTPQIGPLPGLLVKPAGLAVHGKRAYVIDQNSILSIDL